MDGIFNAKEHVDYFESLVAIEHIDISSIIDFGFGHGVLFKEFVQRFRPYKICGIEPSKYIFNQLDQTTLSTSINSSTTFYQEDLKKWCERSDRKQYYFDLGICTSVFQYLPSDVIDFILPILSKRVKYLYFSVPTDIELKRQVEEIEFYDPYAKRRSRRFYQTKLKKYFTVVSNRVLESKYHFNDETTLFSDLMYRN